MKKTIVLILAFLSGIAASFSQSVFPESDAIWNYHRYVNHSLQDEWIYGLSGDTLINGVTYNKLYLLNDTTLQIDEADKYLGGFRQENKQVWFWPADIVHDEELNREYLLFDFGKGIGDSIYYDYIHGQSTFEPTFYSNSSSADLRLGDRYEVMTDIEETTSGHKFFVQGLGVYIENVGSLYGMYGWNYIIPTCCVQNSQIELACFKHHNEIKYLNSKCEKCFCTSEASVKQEAMEEPTIHITPGKGHVLIEASPSDLPFFFELINVVGQKVSNLFIHNEYSQIPSGNHSGVLLYRVKNQGGMVKTGKIITSK